jgi:MscS family membrane protein
MDPHNDLDGGRSRGYLHFVLKLRTGILGCGVRSAICLVLLALASPALCDIPPGVAAAEGVSPRAALSQYIDLCREGKFGAAARYLELPASLTSRGPELARRLKAVLDRHFWFDMDLVSDTEEGNTSDGLARDTEEVARIPGAEGSADPVKMVRVRGGGHAGWLFAAGTVDHVDNWYDQLRHRWVLDHLPQPLLRPGPHELLWWQWLALPILVFIAWALALLAARFSVALLARFAARTTASWDDALVRQLPGPARLGWWLLFATAGVRLLDLYDPAERFIDELLASGAVLALFWAVFRSADILGQLALGSPWSQAHPASRALLPLAVRSSKVTVVALAVVGILSLWGFPVASLLAGLGIGGLALALAAQKTVENLFGSFSIGIDQPFREGDFVKVEDFVGTVERIGLRSTRFRTLDRTLVSLPNGKLADMRVESFAARDRIRLSCTLNLVYGTTAAQLRRVLEGAERVLRQHPKIWPDAVVVRFKALASTSLDVEVMAWFQTSDFDEFQLIRQDVLLAFMDVVESAGSSFAFPTQTVHVQVERPSHGAEVPERMPESS